MASFNLTNFKGFKFFRVTGYLVWGGVEYVGTHVRPCVIIRQIQLGAVEIAVFKTTPLLNYMFNGQFS